VVLGSSLLALLVLYGAALMVLSPASPGQQLSFDTLIRDATQRRIKTARLLDEDARITGTVVARTGAPPTRFWTSYPRSDAATNDLLKNFLANGTEVTIDPQSTKALVRFVAQFLLPLVVLANLFALLFSLTRAEGAPNEFVRFSKVGDRKVAAQARASTTFADVAAAEGALAELAEVRDYLVRPSSFAAMGALPPKGILLVGPPGCGKTLLARAVAGEAQANFFSISGSEFVESLVGVGAARVRDLFVQARNSAPAILFIDELDAVGRQRGAGVGGGHDEREQTLNELLVQMDGFSPTEGVAVMGATNRVDILDPALLRPGRFDRHITVDRPDLEGRRAILALHARTRRLADPETDLAVVARRTAGFTGADLAGVVNEAALLAVRDQASAVDRNHLEEAVERVVGGPRRRGELISPQDKLRMAYHEAGHAVVAAGVGRAAELDKVSIIARGRGLGHLALVGADSILLTRADMEAQVAVAMAGVAAEEMVLGGPSTGSESDLERATTTARDMAGRFGMSTRLGRVRVLRPPGEVFLGRDYMVTSQVSQPTLEHLDTEVRRMLDEQEAIAHAILAAHRPVLDDLAAALVERETVQEAELAGLLAGVRPFLDELGDMTHAPDLHHTPDHGPHRTPDQAPRLGPDTDPATDTLVLDAWKNRFPV